MRIACVVQARLGSARLPNKVLADVGGGEPALARLLRFLQTVKGLDDIVLAVPYNDLFLLDIDVSTSVRWHRGPERDVLSRFVGAAKMAEADAVVRVTGDCPLLDPTAVRFLTEVYRAQPCEYMAFRPEVRGLQSVEILSREALVYLDHVLPPESPDREHCGVTHILRPEFAGGPSPRNWDVRFIPPNIEWTEQPPYRLCLDEPADLEVVRAVVAALGDKANDSAEVVRWLDAHPEVAAINQEVKQAS